MLDPLTGLALAGPVLQLIRQHRAVSSLTTTIRASDDLTKLRDLRVSLVDTGTTVVATRKIIAGSIAADELTDEQQTLTSLCRRCHGVGVTAVEKLKVVSESFNRQQLRPFAKRSVAKQDGFNIDIGFAKVEEYVQELIGLVEVVASAITKTLASTSPEYFKSLSLKEDVLQAGLSTILRLLEHGGANIKQDDFENDGLAQQCMDVSTQSRLDSVNNIDTEPPSNPLQLTRLRRKTILDTLYFRQMTDRIEEVNIAYKTTLEWMFRDKEYILAWSSFPEFLHSTSTDLPYWINGKAGSGKSTLLRFLIRHEKTLEHLSDWSQDKDLQIGHFFSWNLGTTLQKTQTGLLQSLVYQMLRRDQTMIHRVFPDLWHDIDVSRPVRPSPIPFKELRNAFIKAVEISANRRCFCFFVDGIDEFEEDHVHIADLLLSLAAPNLKFVLSSRPADACLDRFIHCPKLRLQDLTADDIQLYIDGRLSSHSTMLEVMQDEPKAAGELVRELKDRASGVFLWVKLVVNSLLDGLRKGDDVKELKVRLRELPPDLGKLYASMLGKMDPNYSRQAATVFRLVRTASVLLDGQCMPTQFLAVAGREFRSVVNHKPVGFETTKIVQWCKFLMRQLYSRCCGLVEVSSSVYTPDWWRADLDNLNREDRDLLSSHIQFLHRTVTEYLYQDDVWNAMVSKSSELSSFNPHENLAYAALHMMKISPLATNLLDMQAYRWAQTVVRAARQFELEEEKPLEDLIDEMDLVLRDHVSTNTHWSSQIEIEPVQKIAISHVSVLQSSIRSRLAFAAFVGLSEYVNRKLEKNSFILDEGIKAQIQQILLQALFSRSGDWTNIELIDRFDVVSCLLEHGANPNETLRGPSFWQCCLQQVGALNCQSASFTKFRTRRRSSRKTLDSSPGQEGSRCRCDPQEVEIWSQLLLCCLKAGARREDIDYLAPFSQRIQGSQICRFGQLCQILYEIKSGGTLESLQQPVGLSKHNPGPSMSYGQRHGANYGATLVSGSATAHLGDEHTYGDKITHVTHNYFGARDSGDCLPQVLPAHEAIQSQGAPETHSIDPADTLAWFRNEVSEVFQDTSSPKSTQNTADFDHGDTLLTAKERTMVRDSHWRGEVMTWRHRRCDNEDCRSSTTGGWDYVPKLKKLLCLSCYQSWRSTKDPRDRDLVFTMEEIFNESFNAMSLVTTTNDSDESDDDEDTPHDYATGPSMKFDQKLGSIDNESDVFVTPRSASISINRPTPSARGDSYSLTSGTDHYLKSYRGRG